MYLKTENMSNKQTYLLQKKGINFFLFYLMNIFEGAKGTHGHRLQPGACE